MRLAPRTLPGSWRDFLNVNGPLCRIEFARPDHVRGREVPDGFTILDNPDFLIIVCYQDGRWGFHSGCPIEAPPRQHFCTQSPRPGFVCCVPQLSSLIQPVRDASLCWAVTDPSAPSPQTSARTKTIPPLIIPSSFCPVTWLTS